MKDGAGSWAPQLSLCISMPKIAAHFVPSAALWGHTAHLRSFTMRLHDLGEIPRALFACLQLCTVSHHQKDQGAAALSVVWQCEIQNLLQPPQMFCLFHISQLLQLCLRFKDYVLWGLDRGIFHLLFFRAGHGRRGLAVVNQLLPCKTCMPKIKELGSHIIASGVCALCVNAHCYFPNTSAASRYLSYNRQNNWG